MNKILSGWWGLMMIHRKTIDKMSKPNLMNPEEGTKKAFDRTKQDM
jgi:hypothetical protein